MDIPDAVIMTTICIGVAFASVAVVGALAIAAVGVWDWVVWIMEKRREPRDLHYLLKRRKW